MHSAAPEYESVAQISQRSSTSHVVSGGRRDAKSGKSFARATSKGGGRRSRYHERSGMSGVRIGMKRTTAIAHSKLLFRKTATVASPPEQTTSG